MQPVTRQATVDPSTPRWHDGCSPGVEGPFQLGGFSRGQEGTHNTLREPLEEGKEEAEGVQVSPLNPRIPRAPAARHR
jgi:hypothetical protein